LILKDSESYRMIVTHGFGKIWQHVQFGLTELVINIDHFFTYVFKWHRGFKFSQIWFFGTSIFFFLPTPGAENRRSSPLFLNSNGRVFTLPEFLSKFSNLKNTRAPFPSLPGGPPDPGGPPSPGGGVVGSATGRCSAGRATVEGRGVPVPPRQKSLSQGQGHPRVGVQPSN